MNQSTEQEELFFTVQEVKALKELAKSTHSDKKTQELASLQTNENKLNLVTRQELREANRRFKLGLDMQEKDLNTLLYTAIIAIQEIYGLNFPKKEEDLNCQFRTLLKELSQILLERNKTHFKEEDESMRMRILERISE